MRSRLLVLVAVLALAAGACSSSSSKSSSSSSSSSSTTASSTASSSSASGSATSAKPKHVFVINLENESYDAIWGSGSVATYLNQTLVPKGQLLEQYFGIGHNSLDNYIAEISGQSPNPATQADCFTYTDFAQTGTAAYDQAVGKGCVYPSSVTTIANQLSAKGLTWRGYMEDMEASATQPKTCRHPEIGQADPSVVAKPGDAYATRHNPFVYFHSIIDTPACNADVVGLKPLTTDLQSVSTTRNLSFITPNLCNDGHDATCPGGRQGGLHAADAWLKVWVPRILASPAFKADGLLVITFDEAETGQPASADACCSTPPSPNTDKPGLTGPGGGRVGTLLISASIKPGTTNATPYNHYALLRSMEDLWGLDHLGFAGAPGLKSFGSDVYDAG